MLVLSLWDDNGFVMILYLVCISWFVKQVYFADWLNLNLISSSSLDWRSPYPRRFFSERQGEPKDKVQIYTWMDATLREMTDLVCLQTWTPHYYSSFLSPVFPHSYPQVSCVWYWLLLPSGERSISSCQKTRCKIVICSCISW